MIAAHDTQALADRAIVATYEKLHADKLGAHWLWCVIEQIAAGVPEAQAFKSYGYYEAGPSRARWDASRLQEQESVLAEHSGCGSGKQSQQVSAGLNPGDQIILRKGRITLAIEQAQAENAR